MVPAFNEETRIVEVVNQLADAGYSVVVIDDGSADNTGARAKVSGAVVLSHVINLGQGAALQTGLDFASANNARYICTFDADGQHCVSDIEALLDALTGSGADVALGSRFLGHTIDMPASRRLILRAAIWFTTFYCGVRLTDAHNGLRVFSRAAARAIRITQSRMAHASEIIELIKARRLSYVEVPVTVMYTDYSRKKGQSALQALRILVDLVVGRALR